MSIVIKVSYKTESELKIVLNLLDPIIKDWHKANQKKVQYNRVYIKTNAIQQERMYSNS